jgi:hypothetical protein
MFPRVLALLLAREKPLPFRKMHTYYVIIPPHKVQKIILDEHNPVLVSV